MGLEFRPDEGACARGVKESGGKGDVGERAKG